MSAIEANGENIKKQLIADLNHFPMFVRSLESLKDEIWYKPLGEGKWSVHDIITHIMRWDDYFNTVTFPLLSREELCELNEHPDYLGFNEQSIRYGKGKEKKDIIEETLRNRQLMITNLERLDDMKFATIYPGNRKFTLESYLQAFFVSHDKHHMNQIQELIRKL